ncbi:MAG: CehA/McbA family metallohydrolase, partial [Acidobacteria bacterium]|nr:CehA/McbA family metallohydrolase [Acidobacteriota bacterium]
NDTHGDGVLSVPPHHWIMTRNFEDERRGGAWILDGLRKPLDLRHLGPWVLPGISVVRQARAQRPAGGIFPWFDIDMPIWWEVPVMMALEPADSLDVIHNQFMQYGIDSSEYWGRPYDRRQLPGREGFVSYSLGLYDRYLNLGFRLPATAGTGTGVMPSPTGYNRVYAQVQEPFTVEKWFTAIRDGRSFVTNGPVLFFRTRQERGRLKSWVEARAREPIDRLEIVANGKVVRSFVPTAGGKTMKAEFSFDPSGYSWVLARCFLKPGVSIRLAQSSPVYLPGRWDARSDAQYFVTWIDDLIALHLSGETRVTDPAQREELLGLYRRARAFYEAKAR